MFELLLIQKKSISVLDYYKKVINLDKIIDKKSVEEVEKIVKFKIIYNSFGGTLDLVLQVILDHEV